MNTKKVTIREISRLANVSVATVSRVIHQNGRFSPETEKRVRDVMAQMNYTPDAVAQGLRMQSMPIVGLIVPDILDEQYAIMVRTVQSKLMEKGFSSVIYNTNEQQDNAQQFVSMLKAQHARGLIYVPDSVVGAPLNFMNIPAVFFERRPAWETPGNTVQILCNDYAAAKESAAQIIADGCKRILLLGDRLGISSHQERMRGFRDGLAGASAVIATTCLVDPQRTSEAIASLEDVFRDGVSVDCIFCTSVRLTIGALAALRAHHVSEKDVLVVGFGEHRLCEFGLLSYRALKIPVLDMAEKSAESLIQLMEGRKSETREYQFAIHRAERDS